MDLFSLLPLPAFRALQRDFEVLRVFPEDNEKRSKKRLADVSVRLDSAWLRWADHLWEQLEEVEMAWLREFRKKLTSALDTNRFLEMCHPKGGPVRTLVRYRMCAPDPPEDAQNITKLAHILRKVLLHCKGTEQEGPAPPTNNERKIQCQLEQRRKKVEGNQIRLGDEIDIYETDLAESLAMWGFGEEDEVFQ